MAWAGKTSLEAFVNLAGLGTWAASQLLLSVTLAATRGNQIRAADLLGVNRNTLRKKIRDLQVQVFRHV